MNNYLNLYLRWMKNILSNPNCTIQSNIIIFDTLSIFYTNTEEDIKSKLKNKILSVSNTILENTSQTYLHLFYNLTKVSEDNIISDYSIPINKDTVSINTYSDEELQNIHYISYNRRKFKIDLKLKEEYIHCLEAKMIIEYETGNIEGGNLIFRILNNFDNKYNPIMDSAFRKLLSKQNPLGYWGLYSKTEFNTEEIESLLNIGFDSLRTLAEYKNKDFCLY